MRRLLVMVGLALLLVGCSDTATLQAEPTPAETPASTPAESPPTQASVAKANAVATAMPTAAARPTARVASQATVPSSTKPPAAAKTAGHSTDGQLVQPNGLPSARVVKIVDGDTIDVDLSGKTERLRLIGLDTPESVDPRQPVQCFAKEASAKASELLAGQTVALEADPTQDDQDRYGRLLRYVWLPDGRLFNLVMISEGYGFEYTYEKPYKYQAAFKAAQQDASETGRGLWAPTTCNGRPDPIASPTGSLGPTARPAATQPGSEAAAKDAATRRGVDPISKDDCPASHPIKGNQGSRSTDDWIYHEPGSRSYAVTDPEECFATVEDAKASGYRAPKQ